jgi:hypothetical protein
MAHAEEDDALPGQDSFIDVVCNMVGILIVLVMIVGVRATGANSPSDDLTPIHAKRTSFNSADEQSLQALEETRQRALQAHRQIEDAVQRVVDLGAQSIVVEAQREQLSLLKAAVEQDIAERRSKLDSEGQRQFDVQRQIAEAEIKLHQLTQEQVALASQPAQVEKVECVPTPIGREVNGEEIHVRLCNGLLAVLPTEELIDEVERRGVDYLRTGLDRRSQAEEVYGPIDGFRMRFLVRRQESESVPGAPRLGGSELPKIYLKFTFLPITDRLGQPIEQALLPDSKFQSTIRARRSAAPAVVAWVYPDSFEELRTLKRELWKTGVPLAVKPLPEGHPISFVTGGQRTIAQ